ncbi:glycoside hydrolase-like protein, putative (macronuclear) [Tetrahymena thermophila SB210]|uniref:Glycoside hydrolase-like protein, putative n=1 Tax=Tetrahymena thermophila (strain SB210) TaxID=312017 RepID=I7MAW8_TETTS|nr:glycoside hydrolase-like protein, putative [Tetrahymena thermophila SB210]EAS06294.1 glycoside hydrolase-like protein, putative [Tetrahymena thermophila SB210]|eukprot:XP_001026539.1 glycoside hydrolase-like protein, putative [Tetrahymena thermophila SB210]
MDSQKSQEYLKLFTRARQYLIKDSQNQNNKLIQSTFKCRDLVSWIQQQTKYPLKEIIKDINENLFNPTQYQQTIYILDTSKPVFSNNSESARFIQEEFEMHANNSLVLNITQDSRNQQRFFFEEGYEQDIYMEDPTKLIHDIRIIIQDLKAQALSDDGSLVDYQKISKSDIFNTQFINLICKLPFIKTQILRNNEEAKVSFFLNLYNILNIHSIIEQSKSNQAYQMSAAERADFYNKYKYNIAGQNYTLNDIEHGILRANDNFGNSKFKTFCLILQGKSLSDKSKPRFQQHDARNKLCCQKTDFRIHFCLNCGAKSCPPIRVYDPENLHEQIELSTKSFIEQNVEILEIRQIKSYKINLSMLFKWYKGDFAPNEQAILQLLCQYLSEQKKQTLSNILQKKIKYQINYLSYDWTVNNFNKN